MPYAPVSISIRMDPAPGELDLTTCTPYAPTVFSRVPIPPAILLGIAALTLIACSDVPTASTEACRTPSEPGCAPVSSAPLGDLGRYTSAVAWPDGRLAIATWDSTHTNLVVALHAAPDAPADLHVVAGRPAPTASPDLRAIDPDAGRFAKIAAQANGQVQVAWFDSDQGAIFWARGDRSGFEPGERVDGDGPEVRGTHLGLALDADERPHLAYRDETRKALRYAWKNNEGTWQSMALDTCAGEAACPLAGREDVGEWAQIAIVTGAGGVALPRIAFYDRLRGDLKLAARNEDGTWLTSTLDGRDPSTGADTGDVGRFLSLAVTPTRTLGLAYFDVTLGVLRYLGPGERPRIVDPGLDPNEPARRLVVGQYPSLGYDALGQAHIVYTDATTPALRHVLVRTGNASSPSRLALPPGAWVALARVEQPQDSPPRLIGAYGAFQPDPSRTRLMLFDLQLEEATP